MKTLKFFFGIAKRETGQKWRIMWLIISWALVVILLVAFVAKAYRSVLQFHRHASQMIREIRRHVELKEWKEAEQKLLPILKKRGYRRQCLLEYVRVLRELQRYAESEKWLDKAEKLKCFGPKYFLEVAHKTFRDGDHYKVVQAFSHVPQDCLEEVDAACYASALGRIGEISAACKVIEPWLSHVSHQNTYLTVGYLYFIAKRYQDAIEFYARAMALGKCSHEVIYQVAHAHRICKNYTQAQELFHQLSFEPRYREEANFNIGLCLQALGQSQKALAIYKNSEYWTRGDARIMKHAAKAAMDQKDYSLAEQCWNLAFRCSTYADDIACLLSYGLNLCILGKYVDAEKVYLKVVQKTPECVTACKALSWLVGIGCATIVSSDSGVEYAKKAVHLTQSIESLELLSACQARVGNFDEAYKMQAFLASYDYSLEQKSRRAQIMRNLRKKLPLNYHHFVEVDTLLVA